MSGFVMNVGNTRDPKDSQLLLREGIRLLSRDTDPLPLDPTSVEGFPSHGTSNESAHTWGVEALFIKSLGQLRKNNPVDG